jgi:serine/threonine protein kinase
VATARSQELLSGRYRLGELLGEGGMAEVFLAEDLRLGRQVAVKMLKPQLGADTTVRYRFEQEARTAARLSHPNIVGIIDTGEDEGAAFIIMERLPGSTLADELENGPLPEARVRDIARQVLSALEAAHTAGIVHRDIKPANVLTCGDGRVKVADFGIATAMDEAQAVTSAGLLVGTPAYVAPERLAGAPATASSDLYSFASVLYQCLTGRRPFEAASTIELISAVREREPDPIARYRPDVDPAFAGVVERTLSKDPSLRPVSARAMAGLLDGTVESDTVEIPGRTEVAGGASDPGSTMVLPDLAIERTRVLPASEQVARQPHAVTAHRAPPAAQRIARSAAARWPSWSAAARRYRILLAFLGAVLLALLISLPLAASSGPGVPTSPTGGSSRAAHRLPALTGVPAPLADAIDKLQQAVR